ncbi:MAG: hypothetical protein ACOVSI_08640 [Gemmatimonas sp.]
MYDLHVPGVGAFALASGLVVSNCDGFGYLLWSEFNIAQPAPVWGASSYASGYATTR